MERVTAAQYDTTGTAGPHVTEAEHKRPPRVTCNMLTYDCALLLEIVADLISTVAYF
jgi:hypothetical protein